MTDGPRILIAEDNAQMLKFYADMFPDMPFDFAMDGHELIRMANLREYALIWVDLTMPFVSGCEGVAAIRNGTGPNVNSCICAVTGDPVQNLAKQEGGCHFDWAFQKPVEYTQMLLWFSNAIAVAKNPHHSP